MRDEEKVECARHEIMLQSTAIRYIMWTSRDEKTALKRICEYISIRSRKIVPSELGKLADDYERDREDEDKINVIGLIDLMVDNLGANDSFSPE